MHRISRWLALALPLVIALWQYGYAVTLPFFTDDANHYRFFQTVTGIVPLWTGQTWSAYYRPAVYSLWKGMIDLQGGFDPVAQHWVNVMVFGLSGVLLSLLMLRLLPPFRNRLAVTVGMGCAFVLVPLHYQAINLVGGLFHMAATAALLFALVCGLHYLRDGNRAALIGCAVGAFLANFSHETGFLVAPFLIATGLLSTRFRVTRRLLIVSVFPMIISVVYIGLWLGLPRVGTEGGLRVSSSLLDNTGMLLQTFVYPLAALLRPFIEGKGTPLLLISLFMGTVVAGIALIAWLNRRLLGLALGGISWYLVAVAPSVLVLQPDYVWNSPRLTMLASVGAVVFWGVVVAAVLTSTKRVGKWLSVPGSVAIVAILALNITFLEARQVEYITMRDYTRELVRVMLDANADEQGALLINAPNYLEAAADQRTFLVQAQFASFMTPEVDYRDYLELNSGERFQRPVEALGVGRVLSYEGGQYVTMLPLIDGAVLLDKLRQPRPIITTQFDPAAFYPLWVGTPNREITSAPIARFGDAIVLTGIEPLAIVQGRLRVTLQWQVQQVIPAKLFVHVLHRGELIAQSDGYVWGNLYPFSEWQTGEQQVDQREIALPSDVSMADLTVLVGLYNEATGDRYTATSIDEGRIYSDNAVPLANP